MTFRLLSVCMTRGWRSRSSTELVLDSGILLITQEEIMQRLRMSRMLSHYWFHSVVWHERTACFPHNRALRAYQVESSSDIKKLTIIMAKRGNL